MGGAGYRDLSPTFGNPREFGCWAACSETGGSWGYCKAVGAEGPKAPSPTLSPVSPTRDASIVVTTSGDHQAKVFCVQRPDR